MKYLLDTCVLSEVVKKQPEPQVLKWLSSKQPQQLYVSSLTWAELQHGVFKLPASKRRNELTQWLASLNQQYKKHFLAFNAETAECWALMTSNLEAQGMPMAIIDSLICATAKQHKLILVTRNTKDFIHSQVQLINPWEN